MTEDILLVEKCDPGYAVLTLNRPDKLNALSVELCRRLSDALAAIEADPATRVVILTGKGRAFCAGLDVGEMRADPAAFFAGMRAHSPARALERMTKPVIGAINGDAVTGGFELSLICDVLIAGRSARFEDTHTRIGLMPGWGISQRLSRAVGLGRAKEISLSAQFVPASRAEAIGLVSRVVPDEDLLGEAKMLATSMLAGSPEVLLAYKKLIDDGYAVSLSEGLRLEREAVSAYNERLGRAQALKRGRPAGAT